MDNTKEIFERMVELAQISTINGLVNDNQRSLFMGETLKIVLIASNDEYHANLLRQYIQKFLNHMAALEGEIKVTELLKEESGAN